MCLIICKAAGDLPCKETFFSGAKYNGDAMGIAYFRDDGQMAVHKWVDQTHKQVKRAWQVVQAQKDRPVLIHFRFTTHGANSFSNCHPFPLGRDAVTAHNGIIPGHYDKDKSDTALFIEKTFRPMYTEFGRDFLKRSHDLLHKDVGASKLATLDGDGEFHFVNESMGEWKDGHWYSNGWHFPNKHYGTHSSYASHTGKTFASGVHSKWNPAGFWEYADDYLPTPADRDAEYREWARHNTEAHDRQEMSIMEEMMEDYAYAFKWEVCGECGMNTDAHWCSDCKMWTTPRGMSNKPPVSPAQEAVKALQAMRSKV